MLDIDPSKTQIGDNKTKEKTKPRICFSPICSPNLKPLIGNVFCDYTIRWGNLEHMNLLDLQDESNK